MTHQSELVYFGAGCFWNAELIYHNRSGVEETEVGWVNVPTSDSKTTKIEVVKVTYNPETVGLKALIDLFWTTHDPTSDRQLQETFVERSVLVALNEAQSQVMNNERLSRKERYPETKTVVLPFQSYQRAPEKDQKYYFKS